MEKIIQLIKDFFNKESWQYDYFEDKNEFRSGIRMDDIIGNLRMRIRIQSDSYTVYLIFSNLIDNDHRAAIAEYLHRANYGLRNGNFEFDYNDGEIRYKSFVDCKNSTPSPSIVADSILIPIFMFDLYGKNLVRLLLDEKTPKELIEEVEHNLHAASSQSNTESE